MYGLCGIYSVRAFIRKYYCGFGKTTVVVNKKLMYHNRILRCNYVSYVHENASSKIQELVTSENCRNCACYLFCVGKTIFKS